MPIRIVLADDHRLVRQGFIALLSTQSDFEVIGEAGDGPETLRVAAALRPDVVITDLMMPEMNGLEVVRRLTESQPETRTILLSMFADEAYVVTALRYGVAGYVLKDADPDDLIRAVREAAAGRRYLSQPFSEAGVQAYEAQERDTVFDVLDTLTPREREVLHLTAENHSNAEIADRLGISRRTAETHRNNLMRKLGLHSQAELVQFAFQRGILKPGKEALPIRPREGKPE